MLPRNGSFVFIEKNLFVTESITLGGSVYQHALGAIAKPPARMAGEPVEIEDVGVQQWQKDGRVDSLLAGIAVDLLINFFLLLWFC